MGRYPFQNVAIERAKYGINLPRQVEEALHPLEQFKEKTASVTGIAMNKSEIQVSTKLEIRYEILAQPFLMDREEAPPGSSFIQTDSTIKRTSIDRSSHMRPDHVLEQQAGTMADFQKQLIPFEDPSAIKLKQNQLLNVYLHQLLIYFREVATKVEEALEQSKSIKHLRELKERLKVFVEKLGYFQVSEKVDVDSFSGHSQIDEIKSAKNKILSTYNKLSCPNLKQILQRNVGITYEQMLCSIVGLDDTFSENYLSKIDPEQRYHASDLVWIEAYFDECSKKLDEGKSQKEKFRILGFNSTKAEFLSKSLEDFPYANHQSLVSWAKEHVCLLFKYDILLNNDTDPCPVRDHVPGVEFDIETSDGTKVKATRVKKGSPEDISLQNKFQNETTEIQTTNMTDRTLECEKFWFHGTDYKSASEITRYGIETTEGKAGKDFSNKNGFYLSPNIHYPLKWISKKPTQAILVFKVDCSFFKQRKGKEFDGPTREWTDFVKFNREKEFRQPAGVDRRTIQMYKSWEYAYGRISKDGANFSKDKPLQTTNEMQLCLRNENIAEAFYGSGRSIEHVIFFE